MEEIWSGMVAARARTWVRMSGATAMPEACATATHSATRSVITASMPGTG